MRAAYLMSIVVLLSFIIATKAAAATVTPRLQQTIETLSDTGEVSVIVRFRNRVNLQSFNKTNKNLNRHAFRSRLLRELHSRHNSEDTAFISTSKWMEKKWRKSLWLINGFSTTLTAAEVNKLAQNPRIENIDLDTVVTLVEPLAATESPPAWNINMVQAPALWSYGYDGQGVVVASMDTGVDINHADLAGSWRGGNNSWFDPYGQHATPADKHGHGTGTMSVILGKSATGTAIGVAPGAKWISAKIFDDAGLATASAIHSAFQWLLNPDGNPATDDAPDVVNNSWGITGTPGCDTEFVDDVQTLKQSGIVVVFSAGNSGPNPGTGLSPATYAESHAVGAVDQGGYVPTFSSRGPATCENKPSFPDVVAPGVNIKVADLTLNGLFPTAYTYLSGTSFSAPHVTGGVALLKSAYPTATVSQLENAINSSAIDILQPGIDNDSGRGLLDLRHALYQLPVDTDGDGVTDGSDNCILLVNPAQQDSDGDGYGNRCDADLNNDNIVDLGDYLLFKASYGTTNAVADLDSSNGLINLGDYILFRSLYGIPPGPSGLVP